MPAELKPRSPGLLRWAGGALLLFLTVACATPAALTEPKQNVIEAQPALPAAKIVEKSIKGAPLEVKIKALGVALPVEKILPVKNVLIPPADPAVAGWWAEGAKPGDAEGRVLIAAHTAHAAYAPFNNLEDLREGKKVQVRTKQGLVQYEVIKAQVLSKGKLARRAEDLFKQTGSPRLILITCEDWNGVEYLSNVVVTAKPL